MTIEETIKEAIASDGRLQVETVQFMDDRDKQRPVHVATHYYVKAGKEVLFKVIVPMPARPPYMIEEYHEDPAVICGHPVTKAFMLAPMLAALLKESKETKAILERVE